MSPEFRRWFQGSRVVDAGGQPLVVYHGTRRQFSQFEPMHPRGAIGSPGGIYFTSSRSVAEEFAQDYDGALDSKSRIVAAHMVIRDDNDGKIIRHPYDQEFVVFHPERVWVLPARSLVFDPDAEKWSPETSGEFSPANGPQCLSRKNTESATGPTP